VVKVARSRVTVRYAIHDGATLRESVLGLSQLRRNGPDGRHYQSAAAPASADDVALHLGGTR